MQLRRPAKAIAVIFAVTSVLAGIALVWRGRTDADRTKSVPHAQEIEKLSQLAQRFRDLAKTYVEKGEKNKAHRAIGTAQELDRKIRVLRQ